MPGQNTIPLPENVNDYQGVDWLRFGNTATPTTRQKILALTIEEVVRCGAADFKTTVVCDRLGVGYSLVNHYFGTKERLIAEASALTYRKAVLAAHDRIVSAPQDAEKRFRAFIHGEVEWYATFSAWAVLVTYPIWSSLSRDVIGEKYGAELGRYFEFSLAMLDTLVADLRNNTLSSFDFDVDTYPKPALAFGTDIALDTVSVIWSVHGLALWSSTNQIGALTSSHPSLLNPEAITHHIDLIVQRAKGS